MSELEFGARKLVYFAGFAFVGFRFWLDHLLGTWLSVVPVSKLIVSYDGGHCDVTAMSLGCR